MWRSSDELSFHKIRYARLENLLMKQCVCEQIRRSVDEFAKMFLDDRVRQSLGT